MTISPQTPEAVAFALTIEIINYERNAAYGEEFESYRDHILSLYEECLKVTKGNSRNNADAKQKYREALEEMHG